MHGVFLNGVTDAWVRDIELACTDNGVNTMSESGSSQCSGARAWMVGRQEASQPSTRTQHPGLRAEKNNTTCLQTLTA